MHARYIRIIDDDRLEEWPALFQTAGHYTIITRENHARGLPLALMSCDGRGMMQDRVTGLRKINVYEPHCLHHQTSGLQIEQVDEDRFSCTSGFLVIRTMHSGAAGIFATGVYQDLVVQEPCGELLFAARKVITDSRQTDTLLVIPL